MTAQLPSKNTLQKIIETANEIITVNNGTNEDISKNDTNKIIGLYDRLKDDLASHSVVKSLAEFALAAHEQEPVGIVHGVAQTVDGSSFVAMVECKTRLSDGTELFSHPAPVPAVPDAVSKLLNILDRHTVELGWCAPPISLAELVIARDGREELDAIRAMLNGGKS